ncbi:DUF2479 domain-containing protein [Pediococcus pentosaceus]|uniref:phage baseplate upper protein n=1 Tax=Pediococcus pentosaceus TaxID=1255 RepID=UPI0013030C29|nr:phage baseplate upper protein [Pediococcus pentosaceus]QGZ70139.1 DUF2479 domain-containing protein [Pediococcus pentosaceus]
MSMYLKFRIGKDKRKLVPINGFELKDADSNNPQWLQGRQNEDGGRQVFVDLEDENGSPVNLTGASAVFKGVLPGGQYKIWDHKSSTIIDAQAGRFRYTFPKRAMAIAGSYKQAFFEIFREGTRLATLEFNFEVLADLVEENIIPSDYITPFEDLYGKLKDYIAKANGDFEAAMTQWKKDVADLITELNADIGGINLTITEIKTQLSALEDKIKADGLLTQADFDAQMKTLMDTIESELAILKQPICVEQTIYGDPVEEQAPEIKQKLDSLTVGINPDKFNFVFITDPHYASSEETANLSVSYGVNHVNRALYLDQYVDMMVLGGDNIDGNQASIEGILTDQAQIATEFLFGSDNNSDKFPLKGNHDDGTERQVYFEAGRRPDRIPSLPAVITDAQFKRDYHTGDLLFGETRKGNSNYFYKDYPDKKIRIIGLDSNDRPEIKNDDGTEKYLGIWHLGYRQEQINWLANVALKNVPEDYTTLIVAHMQSWVKNGTNIHNADLVNKIIGDFITGGSTTLTSDDKDWEVNVKTDFTQQGARVLAGWIHGHEHSENIRTDGGYNNIGILASVGLGEAQNWLGDTDGWNLIELDTEKRTLTLKGFGIATDRKFDY